MSFLDESILGFLQSFGQLSQKFNVFLVMFANNDIFKGIITMTFFWWAWHRGQDEELRRNRETLVATLAGAFLSLFFGRLFQIVLPFRDRPMNSHTYHFLLPLGTHAKMEEWSSFPSDHAALFYSLATGLLLVSRRAGILAYLYFFVAICFPRMYLGLHYPTDILAGAIMGAGCTLACVYALRRMGLSGLAVRLSDRSPSLFYAGLFFLTFELATLFDSLREMGSFLAKGEMPE